MTRTIRKLLAIGACLGSAVQACAASPPSIFGNWRTDDGAAIVKVDHCGDTLCGKIVQILDPKAPPNDINNPDEQKRSQPLVGTIILKNFVGSASTWKDGSAYDPKAGRNYHSSLALLSQEKLKVTGCVLFICRSRVWTRATN